ncbi:hypothetical protein Avbf_16842 [Armadillidium vulgare]|nr:hypothetical protein Avbf_16842 [Armadillidium vulgare]
MPQNITIPDTILAHLMKEQVESLETYSPWGIIFQDPVSNFFSGIFNTETTPDDLELSVRKEDLLSENYVSDGDVTTTLLPKTENLDEMQLDNGNVSSTTVNTMNRIENGEINDPTTISALETDTATMKKNFEKFVSTIFRPDIQEPSYTVIPVDMLKDNYDLYYHSTPAITEETTSTFSTEDITYSTFKDSSLQDTTLQTNTSETFPTDTIPTTTLTTIFEDNNPITELTKDAQTTVPPENISTETTTSAVNILSKSSEVHNINNIKLEGKNADKMKPKEEKPPTNVLTPLEMAPFSHDKFVQLSTLQDQNDNQYMYDDSPLYLEDIEESFENSLCIVLSRKMQN